MELCLHFIFVALLQLQDQYFVRYLETDYLKSFLRSDIHKNLQRSHKDIAHAEAIKL